MWRRRINDTRCMSYAYSTRNGCSKFIIFCLLCSDSSGRGNNIIRPLQQYYTEWYITYVSPVTEGRLRIWCRLKVGIARGNEIIIKKKCLSCFYPRRVRNPLAPSWSVRKPNNAKCVIIFCRVNAPEHRV